MEYLTKYEELLQQLLNISYSEEVNNKIKLQLENPNKEETLKKFFDSINQRRKFQKGFIDRKVKLFYQDEIETIVPNVSMKKLLKVNDLNLDVIWDYLQLMVGLYAFEKDEKELSTEIFQVLTNKNKQSSNIQINDDNPFNLDKNSEVFNMVNDIFSSFETDLDINNGNPMESIFKISEKITNKYGEKIKKGEMDLGNLFSNMNETLKTSTSVKDKESIDEITNQLTDLLSSMSKPKDDVVVMDENFSTEKVKTGSMKKETPNLGSLFSAVSKLGNELGGEESRDMLKNELNMDLTDLEKLEEEYRDKDEKDLKAEDFIKINQTLTSIFQQNMPEMNMEPFMEHIDEEKIKSTFNDLINNLNKEQ